MEFLAANGAAILFYLFAAVTVAAAVAVVVLRNPMYGAIALLVSFLGVAALFLLRHAEFVFVVQIFVYGGGIMVLFLFVIMLVNLQNLPESEHFLRSSPVMLVFAVLLLGLLAFFLLPDAPPAMANGGAGGGTPAALVTVDGEQLGNTEALAWTLYRDYLLPFEIASLFLLVAMIGAVVLGRRS